jgi:23S rRNA (pseudouridine1915-N3)-methyltransferase
MKITILAVGRMKGDPTATLFDAYVARLPWKTTLVEVEDKSKASLAKRREAECAKLLAAVPPGALLIALDPRGRSLSSEDFARAIGRWRSESTKTLAFAIGGADGFTDDFRAHAQVALSFGSMTWPHLLARVMLAEQLYRASAILSGHPYHRGG